LLDQVQGPPRRHWPVAPHELRQAHSRQELHHVIKRAVIGPAVVENVDAVPVRELRGGLHLALESGQHLGIARLLRANHLDGAGPFHQHVLGQIDIAHAAAADEPFELVLSHLPGPQHFVAQRVDRAHAEHRAGKRQGHDQYHFHDNPGIGHEQLPDGTIRPGDR
jgi:hypothetical protein